MLQQCGGALYGWSKGKFGRWQKRVSETQTHLNYLYLGAQNPGRLKLNTNASVINNISMIGFGGVLRDHNGMVVGCFSKTFRGSLSVEDAELVAIREALLWGVQQGWQIDEVESNSLH
ncbi:hypothetical protein PanWU01x14_151270 [Parasponia andersonii]|uniref:RNase H type-1 domain-containing protein n=1 Tax=Parasponia andersonii TaxID=3476 RepID=A0A2P5CHR2_PARAD|nr:hypothetical protein PanWU01x14_151270 [Parasponia andersonii]